MEERRTVRPMGLLLWVWGLTLGLTAYGPDVVRDAVDKSDLLREQAWLHVGIDGLEAAGQAVGLDALRARLSETREAVNAPYTVLEHEEPEPDIEPPPAVPTATVADAPDALVHVPPRRPRRILVIGASSIQFAIGVELERRLPTYEGVRVKRFGQLATGLARPDFFDWPKKLTELARAFRPDLVICNFGGNGAQAIPTEDRGKVDFRTPEWDEVYGERVAELVEIARANGAEVVFMGMPTMRKKAFTSKMKYLNRVQAQAAEAAGAMFVSTFEMAANPDGSYRKTITYQGKRGLMRTSDGVHYRKLGAKYVVEQVLQAVERRYRLVPPDEGLAVAEGHAFVSKVASSTVAYTAYVPRGARAEAKKPGLLLTPAAGEDWFTWPNHPHRALQRAAEDSGAVLIVPARAEDLDALTSPPHNGHGPDETPRAELVEDATRYLPITGLDALEAVPAARIAEVVASKLAETGVEMAPDVDPAAP